MTDNCIVNFATGGFLAGQIRLQNMLKEQGYDGHAVYFTDESELPGCPRHGDAPYAFKSYALKKAQQDGYRYVLWMDSSVYPVRDITEAFDMIAEDGYLLLNGGWCSGQWCSDNALGTLGVTREQLFSPQTGHEGRQYPNWPHLMACVIGLDLENSKAKAFLDKYYEYANDGVTIQGAWDNGGCKVSIDPRVRGHRHDQTIASVVSWKLGMKNWREGVLVYDETGDTEIPEKAIFVLRHP